MWPYYGGKRRLAPTYPPPVFGTIIEPFAGSAVYSCMYPDRQVILVERDPDVAALWRYLIHEATPERILALPVLATGDRPWEVSGLCDEERMLLLFHNGFSRPMARPAEYQADKVDGQFTGSPVQIGKNAWRGRREYAADLVGRIKHWQIIEGDYTDAPDVRATWFIDPPYQACTGGTGGSGYRHGNWSLDFAALGDWCRSRRGQTIVCEYGSPEWLPFVPHVTNRSQRNAEQHEVVWLNGPQSKPGAAATRRRQVRSQP